jgi:hypothetical protein
MQDEADSFKKFIEHKEQNENELVAITEETKWLGKIKDVLDELNIMAVLFDDQKRIIKTMDGIVKSALSSNASEENRGWQPLNSGRGRSYPQSTDPPIRNESTDEAKAAKIQFSAGDNTTLKVLRRDPAPLGFSVGHDSSIVIEDQEDIDQDGRIRNVGFLRDDPMGKVSFSAGDNTTLKISRRRPQTQRLGFSVGHDSSIVIEDQEVESKVQGSSDLNARPTHKIGAIWGGRGDPEDFSLPIAMVNASIEEIEGMTKRAQKAYQAVS